jgi:transposase-like protein
MAQYFLLSARARTLSLGKVLRLTDAEAETTFAALRWAATDGKPVCPHCECPTVWDCRKVNGAPRWRCKACRKSFSVTSGTLFAHHKMPLRNYLAAIAIFMNEVKGKSALAMSRDLDVQYKNSFVLLHKLREAMASELKGRTVGGDGKTVEIDGGYFGGYVKPANHRENRRDRRLGPTSPASAGSSSCCGSGKAERCRPCSSPSRPPSASSPLASPRGPKSRRTKRARGTTYRPGTPCSGSTTSSCTAPALASTRTAPRNSSAACAGARSATITTLPVPTWSATPKRRRGGKTLDASPMASKFSTLPGWRVTGAKPWAGPHFVLAPTRASRIQAMCELTG